MDEKGKRGKQVFFMYTGDRGTVEKVIENIYVSKKYILCKAGQSQMKESTKTLQTQNICCNICSVVQHLLQWKFLRSGNPC